MNKNSFHFRRNGAFTSTIRALVTIAAMFATTMASQAQDASLADASLADASLADASLLNAMGQQLYGQQCAHCHGDQGQGSTERRESLVGDLPVEDLARYIDEAMPEEDPESCVGEDASAVAQFVYDRFYSPAAQQKIVQPRVELSRLTVRQYQESVADLVGLFLDPHWQSAERGLKANYFAARNRTNELKLSEQIDATLDFGDGVPHFEVTGEYKQFAKPEGAKDANLMNQGFSVYWNGSLIAPETGAYKIIVESKNGFQLWINDMETPLIDQGVRSDDVEEHPATVYLLGGRVYPLRLDFFSYPEPPAKIRLLWKPPSSPESVIPAANLFPHRMSPSYAVSTAFPADDSSAGYARGISVSQQWDESNTSAAIETANWVAENLWRLANTKETDSGRFEKVKTFCQQFVEHAFVRPLNEDELSFYVGQHFENDLPVKDQVKRVVILALKSPRFLYPAIELRDPNFNAARQLALTLWDSLPDQQLYDLACDGKLTDPAIFNGELHRMVDDPRSKSKLLAFFHIWLKTDKAADITKDKTVYPDFDDATLADLRRSLELYLQDVVWSEQSDFRQLFLADYLYANPRLADFYGLQTNVKPDPTEGSQAASDDGEEFKKVSVDPQQRAGILTHPYLMAGLAYHKASSPIHRGVFVARNLLGRSLKQPPDNVKPLTEEFNPAMTTRQRVEHQTKETACMNCHSVINPLGFSLENFDAVGRFRTQEKQKQIDVSAAYKKPTGETVALAGARDLANFLADDEQAQRSFINQLFHHYVKQPVAAYGADQLDQLHEEFSASEFNIRQLLIDIAKVAADPSANDVSNAN